MNYRPRGHMQKQFSSISETVQSSQNSSNSCTVQPLQYRFNTKLMSIGHPRPSSRTHTSSKILRAKALCSIILLLLLLLLNGTSAIRGLRGAIRHSDTRTRSCRCPSLVYRPDGLAVDVVQSTTSA